MKSIWKYTLQTTNEQSVEMPINSQVLTIQNQNGNLQVWCLVDIDNKRAFRNFRTIGTGYSLENDFSGKYIGTYQIHGGALVFHVFDLGFNNFCALFDPQGNLP